MVVVVFDDEIDNLRTGNVLQQDAARDSISGWVALFQPPPRHFEQATSWQNVLLRLAVTTMSVTARLFSCLTFGQSVRIIHLRMI